MTVTFWMPKTPSAHPHADRRGQRLRTLLALSWLALTAQQTESESPLLGPLTPMPLERIGMGKSLTLREVLQSVEDSYPALLAERQRLLAAQGAVMAARGAFDPQLNVRAYKAPLGYYDYYHVNTEIEAPTPLWGTRFFGGWRTTGDTLPSYYGELQTLDGGELRGGLSVPLWRDGPVDARRASRQQSLQERTAAEQDVQAMRLTLRLAATQAYWRWSAAGQRYQVTAALLDLAEVRDGQLAVQVAEGSLAAIERLENRRAIFARRSQVIQAQRDLQRESYALSLFWRDDRGAAQVPPPHAVPARNDAEPPQLAADVDAAVAAAVAKRPDLAAIQARLQKLTVATRLARNQFAPRVDLDLSASKDLGSGDAAAETILRPTVLEGALRLSMPLPFRQPRGALQQARALQAEAQHRADLRLDNIAVEVRDAWSALQASYRRLSLSKQESALAQAVAAAERTRFDLGSTSLLIVNLREQAAADADRNVVDAAAAVQVAQAAWQTTLGQLSTLQLAAPNPQTPQRSKR